MILAYGAWCRIAYIRCQFETWSTWGSAWLMLVAKQCACCSRDFRTVWMEEEHFEHLLWYLGSSADCRPVVRINWMFFMQWQCVTSVAKVNTVQLRFTALTNIPLDLTNWTMWRMNKIKRLTNPFNIFLSKLVSQLLLHHPDSSFTHTTSVELNNNVETSYFTHLKMCYLMTTFRCPTDIETLLLGNIFSVVWSKKFLRYWSYQLNESLQQ